MIRIALCDDEQQILDTVSLQIKKYAESRQDDIMETVCFRSANALLSALEDQKAFDIFCWMFTSAMLSAPGWQTPPQKGHRKPHHFPNFFH